MPDSTSDSDARDQYVLTTFGADPAAYAPPAADQAASAAPEDNADASAAPNEGGDTGGDMGGEPNASYADGSSTGDGEPPGAGEPAAEHGGATSDWDAPPDPERPALGTEQQQHAAEVLAGLPPEDRDKVLQTLAECNTPEEAEYTAKALAAGRTPEEIAAFQKEIAGKDKAWLEANLHMVGASSGQGVKQQWSYSCQATEAEAMKAELDPMYALQMHKDNPRMQDADDADGAALNPQMAEDQRRLLEGAGGKATDRDKPGEGAPMNAMLNENAKASGVTFDRVEITNGAEMAQALDEAQQKLRSGLPVPIKVGSDDGASHAAMMTSVDEGPPRRFAIHDPWSGETRVYDEADITQGKLAIGACTTLKTTYPPTQHHAP